MRRLFPADELAEIRAEITRLQTRAAQIETALLRNPDLGQRGNWYQAEVTHQVLREFDPALLPQGIRDDAHYLREVIRRDVVLIPVRGRPLPLRPGWPIRRAADGSLPLH